MAEPIHLVAYASQPSLRISCTGEWTRPAWKEAKTDREGVYRADNGGLYTFTETEVTCGRCREVAHG